MFEKLYVVRARLALSSSHTEHQLVVTIQIITVPLFVNEDVEHYVIVCFHDQHASVHGNDIRKPLFIRKEIHSDENVSYLKHFSPNKYPTIQTQVFLLKTSMFLGIHNEHLMDLPKITCPLLLLC